jgi:hypothetical protein
MGIAGFSGSLPQVQIHGKLDGFNLITHRAKSGSQERSQKTLESCNAVHCGLWLSIGAMTAPKNACQCPLPSLPES